MKSTFVFLSFILSFFSFAQSQNVAVLFETDKSEISLEQQKVLNHFLDSIQVAQEYIILVKGHTDSDGRKGYNQSLSERRALAVANYFYDKGVSSNNVEVTFYGEDDPLADNQTELGKQKNRRVDVELHIHSYKERESTTSIFDLYDKLTPDPEVYLLLKDKDTLVTTTGGTLIQIDQGSFNWRSDSPIELRITEYLNLDEMLRADLTTTSNGGILSTGGMFYVEAFQDEEKIELTEAKSLLFMVPNRIDRAGALLYTGDRDHDSIMNWTTQQSQPISSLNCLSHLGCGYCNCISLGKCRFFWCRVNNFFSSKKKAAQKRRKELYDRNLANNSYCAKIDSLYAYYGIENHDAVHKALYPELYKRYNVNTQQELFEAMEKERVDNIEEDIRTRNVSLTDLNYYVFRSTDLDWINIDYPEEIPDANMVAMQLNYKPTKDVDFSLVLKKRRAILPIVEKKGKYYFDPIPDGEEAVLVALKYKNGTPMMDIKPITTGDKIVSVDLEKVSLFKMKNELKKLQFD
ncbi:MAG: OmpA family protein [Schleiferiaceae bacterium]|jgi:hypothetical protein|nr:OmpA family protein [Schleiferiaceae bacterium]